MFALTFLHDSKYLDVRVTDAESLIGFALLLLISRLLEGLDLT